MWGSRSVIVHVRQVSVGLLFLNFLRSYDADVGCIVDGEDGTG